MYSKFKSDEELCEKLIHKLPATCQDEWHKHAAKNHRDLTLWDIFWDWLKEKECAAKHACRLVALTNNFPDPGASQDQEAQSAQVPLHHTNQYSTGMASGG